MDERIAAAWQRHGEDPAGVAAGFAGLVADATEADVPKVAALVLHVETEHLGRWEIARALIAALPDHPARSRSLRVLDLAEHGRFEVVAPSDDARVLAQAAGLLGARRDPAAADLLARAVREAAALPDADPAVRILAVTANNLACELEGRPDRDAALLRAAAREARVHWGRAGTWLEVERAEYRLAKSHLALGELGEARVHARRCHRGCLENGADADELGYAERLRDECAAAALHAESTGSGRWRGRVGGGWMVCADRGLAVELLDLADGLDAVFDAVRAHAATLSRVPFERRPDEGFAVADCGLDGDLAVGLLELHAAGRATLVCSTGLPDGHVDYVVSLEEGRPTALVARI